MSRCFEESTNLFLTRAMTCEWVLEAEDCGHNTACACIVPHIRRCTGKEKKIKRKAPARHEHRLCNTMLRA